MNEAQVYGSPRVDPLMSPRLNERPKSLSELEGRWWKLGLGSGDRRRSSRLEACLLLVAWYVMTRMRTLRWQNHFVVGDPDSSPTEDWSRTAGRWRGDVGLQAANELDVSADWETKHSSAFPTPQSVIGGLTFR